MISVLFLSCKTNFDDALKSKNIELLKQEVENDLAVGCYIQALKTSLIINKEDSLNQKNLYRLASLYAMKNNKDSSFYYLDKAIVSDSTPMALCNPDYINLLNDTRWDQLKRNQIEKIKKKFKGFKNVEMTTKLWEMYIKDQAYYSLTEIQNQKCRTIYMKDSLWNIKHKLNLENVADLEKMIRVNGWPKKSDVGKFASSAAFLIIQHADLEPQKKYLPLLEEAVLNEEASPQAVALLSDRIKMYENKMQKYGSQIRIDEKSGKHYVFAVEDPAKINERRLSVGLDSIEKYAKRWNIIWNLEDQILINKQFMEVN
ncbi:DUF6624 domain-containing protein [Flavobacterium sp. '19STA2R22 D10 B1']|uniref:DUF6624 domain-containing protein n=1 Tax=Flavobacterium aerium TaxID=3037261 RepID=UPI00278BBF37|nr:DUF6624 domain-containing protein [Flavobacterium sp. '19STA2R22 D10 B1']